MTAVVAGLCLLLLLPLVVAAIRQPALVAMAGRNVARRRTEAALVIGGALLGTAIITSAFVVGDVIDGAVADEARTRYGPIDLTVTTSDPAVLEAATPRIAATARDGDLADLDGTLPVAVATATLEAPDRDTAVPRVEVVELDVAQARTFGSEPAATGLADVADLAPGEALVGAATAERLDLAVGDRLLVHTAGTTAEVTVAEVVEAIGLAGYGGAIVAPGTLSAATAVDAIASLRHQLLVSLDGAGIDTREVTGEAVAAVRAALDGVDDVRVDAPKAAVLDAAEQEGAGFTELFATIGAFSVLAGVLLLVNLFTMLAEERRTELGVLRAVGFTRRRLTRTFALEGVLYAVPAAVLGAGLGLGIGWLVATVAGRLLDVTAAGARYPLVVEPTSLAAGAALGLLVSLVTVWLASVRVARLTIVRAIRDLPEPSGRRTRARTLVLSAGGVVAGVTFTLAGVVGEAGIPLLLGVPVAGYAATPWLRRVVGERRSRLLVGAVALGWSFGVVPLFGDIMRFDDAATFVLQGVVSTAGAVSLAGGLDRVWAAAIAHLGRGGGGLAARLAVAYPRARPTRTSLLLGMFALVTFTVTVLSTVSVTFDRSSATMAADVAIGADVLLDTPLGARVEVATLLDRADVDAVGEVTRGVATFTADHLEASRGWTVTGFDEALLARGVPAALAFRDPAYPSDAAAYRAVLDDPSQAIVPEGFLAGVGSVVVGVGDTVEVLDPVSGVPSELTVVGVGNLDWLDTGVLVGRAAAATFTDGAEVGLRRYLEVVDDADPGAVAASLSRAFLVAGAEAHAIGELVDTTMQRQRGLFSMLQGYLGLGLLIGTAGLGVVMVRAVRERRPGIATLRAMGATSGLVRRTLLLEAGLLVVQGTVIGVLLGLATARQLLGVLDADLAPTVPWLGLLVIVAVPLLASSAATAWPATRAAAIRPAVALRTAE